MEDRYEISVSAAGPEMIRDPAKLVTGWYERYSRRLYARALGILGDRGWAEDALQTVMLQGLIHAERLSRLGEEALFRYLLKSVTNISYDYYRKNSRYFLCSDRPWLLETEAELPDPERQYILRLELEMCAKEAAALPGVCALTLYASAFLGLSAGEIAAFSCSSPAAVRKRLERSRKRIIKKVSSHFFND